MISFNQALSSALPNMTSMPLRARPRISARDRRKCFWMSRHSLDSGLPKTPTSSVWHGSGFVSPRAKCELRRGGETLEQRGGEAGRGEETALTHTRNHDRPVDAPPLAEVVRLEAADDHARVDVAAEAQLEPDG